MKLIGTTPADLYKFCPAEFDVSRGCNSLRLGTLYGFREEENHLLRDEDEGTFQLRIQFPRLTAVSSEWFSELDDGSSNFVYIDQLVLGGAQTHIKGVTFNRSSHNCWVFCVSRSNTAAGNVSETHESKWSIRGTHLQEFASFLSDQLFRSLTADDLPDELRTQFSISDLSAGLSLQYEAHSVDYQPRTHLVESEKGLPVKELRELKAKMPFLKPRRFEEEEEFRFAFWLNFRNQRVSIPDRPKIISLRQVDKMIGAPV